MATIVQNSPGKQKRPPELYLSWLDIDRLVDVLCDQIETAEFDYVMVLSRGGLIPGGLVTKRLKIKKVLVASIEAYDDHDKPLRRVRIYSFPDEIILEGKTILVIDDVWDSGRSIQIICKKIRRAGGRPLVAVLHFKTKKSHYPSRRPDFYASIRNIWIHYPWEKKRPRHSAAVIARNRRRLNRAA